MPHPSAAPTTATLRALLLLGVAAALFFPGSARAAFDLERLALQARELADQPYRSPSVTANRQLAALSYDDYRDIRFRPAASLWREAGLPFELQFFHVGRGYTQPVRMHEVVDGEARRLELPKTAFDYGRAAPAMAAQRDAEVAGFRVHTALNTPEYKDELIVFLGASYFRAVGAGQHYGLSARGLAVDTGAATGEEFPAFEAFWVERPAKDASTLTVYALLNGPRVTGAYRFVVKPGAGTEVDVEARLFLREADRPVATLGIAPLTSMFFGGENQPHWLHASGDFRPEVHDSDGLQIATASGEWLWRPLLNPRQPFTTSFAFDAGVRGFGLMQRDRAFVSYEDPEARYDRRPSVWITPHGDWGPGRVELMQFHTGDETNDNVVAYWVPARLPAPGQPLALGYTMHWQGDDWQRPPAGHVQQSRIGRSYEAPQAGELQFNVDFTGTGLALLPDSAAPEAVVTPGDNARVLLANVYRHPVTKGWRMSLKVQRLDPTRPLELRAFLRHGSDVLTETWTYALPPNETDRNDT